MASAISHAVAALSIGTCFYRPQIIKRVWVTGMVCSVLPDLDVIGFRFGIRYGDFWGHRGFTHSLVFAALLASMVSVVMFQRGASGIGRVALLGGLGVAFFSPFDNTRYFLPWRPIRVSPIAVTRFFTPKGYAILQNEAVWIWLPAIRFTSLVLTLRRRGEEEAAVGENR